MQERHVVQQQRLHPRGARLDNVHKALGREPSAPTEVEVAERPTPHSGGQRDRPCVRELFAKRQAETLHREGVRGQIQQREVGYLGARCIEVQQAAAILHELFHRGVGDEGTPCQVHILEVGALGECKARLLPNSVAPLQVDVCNHRTVLCYEAANHIVRRLRLEVTKVDGRPEGWVLHHVIPSTARLGAPAQILHREVCKDVNSDVPRQVVGQRILG
mmetsp:Transcript_22170/g.66634  ORF Transcript_22170/g.66634 Transcript_22170/m.66634 type:complete len:218 (+) Transcript_22170:977-1630(+)